MSLGFIFWLLMLLAIFSWIFYWRAGTQYPWAIYSTPIFFLILFFIVGWKIFGFAIQP